MGIEAFKIALRKIPIKGLEINDEIPCEYIGLTKEDYVHFIKPLKVRAKVNKVENTILCVIDVSSRFESFCSRSFERLELDWESHFETETDILPGAEFVDIAEEIRQEVITRVPIKLLSESEMAKEKEEAKKNPKKKIKEEDVPPPNTHQPFKDLEL